MADERIPEEMIVWMNHKGWGAHHDQWHFERRWDFWHAISEQPGHPAWVDDLLREAISKGWQRSPIQDGEPGNGEDFLFMHRAMFHLLADNFPQHLHFIRGWQSPPTDPNDMDDPLPPDEAGSPPNPAKGPLNPNMASAISKIQSRHPDFVNDDEFGLFLETNLRPVPGNPLARSSDPETGLHNYLHNRWSDATSPINLGDPTVNIFNHRFWKLHGWIDHQWWRFRKGKGFSDSDASYTSKLAFYVQMMNQDNHHLHFAHVLGETAIRHTRNVFALDVL